MQEANMELSINREAVKMPPQHCATRHTRLGAGVMLFGFVGFMVWAAFAPLDKGVASSGVVTVSGNRKVVQSPLNGAIRAIHVREGQQVKAGEPLVELNQTEAQAQADTLRNQFHTAQVTEARLLAEHDGLKNIAFPLPLDKEELEQIAPLLSVQNSIFQARVNGLASEISSYKHALEGSRLQLSELQQVRNSKLAQRRSLQEQVISLSKLAEEGYLPRNRYLELQQQLDGVSSALFETQGQIAQLKKKVAETSQRIAQRHAEYRQEVTTQLTQAQSDKLNYQNQLKAADWALKNTRIDSPVSGKVIGLNVFTLGGIVSQGQQLMEILPADTPLMIEARLAVEMVDKVHPSLPVDIMFTAFNQNTTPKIPGFVSLVSADRLTDSTTGEPYYQMQIEVSAEGKEKLAGLDVKAGMPVEVFVNTGSRSLLSYFFKPIADRASTSLTEE